MSPRRLITPFCVVAMLLLISVQAQGSVVFQFNYSIPLADGSGVGVTASGEFLTTDIDPTGTYYTIIDIIGGRWNGLLITGLYPPGGYAGNDNILNAVAPFLTYSGVSFTVDGFGDNPPLNDVNIYYDSGYTENNASLGSTNTFDLVRVAPEPYSFLLVALTLPMLIRFRKRI